MLYSAVIFPPLVLCLFVFLTVLILFPTVVLKNLSKSNKQGWLIR